MREIEFRAVTENGIFIVPSQSFSLSICDTGRELVMWGSDGIVDSFPVLSMDQFTGLRDKEGVKIFEGDIVDIDNFGKYKVIWDDDSACFFTVLLETAALESFMYVNHFDPVLLEYKVSVIGNIHQHPHLLEQKK